jgi:uncharacterized phage protein (TIGR02218 family)
VCFVYNNRLFIPLSPCSSCAFRICISLFPAEIVEEITEKTRVKLLSISASKASGMVALVNDRVFQVSGLDGFADDHFSRGTLTWGSGANAGQTVKVKLHRVNDGRNELTVWHRPVNAIQPGDAFTVRAGCPHTFSACQSKFSNGVNFRGFPHMPGNDFVLGYAVTGETDNDGSAIVG